MQGDPVRRHHAARQDTLAVALCVALIGPADVALAEGDGEGFANTERMNEAVSRVRRNDFDDAGGARCAQDIGQPLQTCAAWVARSGAGTAAVRVSFPNGFSRILKFSGGVFVSANATMSGVGTDIDWRREGDRLILRVEDQRYELEGAFVFGRMDDP
ncbi:hypothetical protein [Maricaulis maris]|uniref:hypothetical protein n=1 Tax=Maricaulis maris TaxID=74318 RepID=UPI003A8CFD7E